MVVLRAVALQACIAEGQGKVHLRACLMSLKLNVLAAAGWMPPGAGQWATVVSAPPLRQELLTFSAVLRRDCRSLTACAMHIPFTMCPL